jgi:DNA-binding transcriptional regulator YhcF (GntR family)
MNHDLAIDPQDPTPPFEQLRRQLAELIHTGTLAPGTRLPPVRQIAADLALATGTVARTYRELEAAQLLVTRRGGGTRVAEHPPGPSPEELLQAYTNEYVNRTRRLGLPPQMILETITRALSQ